MNYNIEEFKLLYKQAFCVELTDEQSEVKARALLSLYKAVYGSPDLTLKQYENRNSD